MNVRDAIVTRRSVRSFTDRPVPYSDIKSVLETAIFAPSAGNAQPWCFVVVDEPSLVEKACRLNPYGDWGKNALSGIIVCGDLHQERYEGFWAQDCAAVTQNILLMIHEKGLGATWTGVFPVKSRVEGFRKLFMIPENVVPFSFVLLGFPNRRMVDRQRSLEDKLHINAWKSSTEDYLASFARSPRPLGR